MVYSTRVPSTLMELAGILSAIPSNNSIYLFKDINNSVTAYISEHAITNTNNMGYAYQFIDGSTSYTNIPISNINQIPWDYPYTILTASSTNLWASSLRLWLDAKETKSISVTLQKFCSKSYIDTNLFIENTTSQSFTYTSPSLSLTSNSSIESNAVETVYAYWKLGMVFTLPTQTMNTVLFQHNRFKIKLTSQTAPDSSTQSMIGIFDNDVFKRGIMLKPSEPNFKYQLYTDNTGNLIVSGNTSVLGGTPSYYQATTAKIYIGNDSAKTYPSNMVLHELVFYESVANDIVATSANISTYFTTRHSLTTYADATNIAPATWTNAYSRGDRRSIISVNTNFAITSSNGGTIQNWVDGSLGSAYCFYYTAGQAVSGKYMGFILAVAQKITGFKIISSNPDTAKVFDFQGGPFWGTLQTFTYLDVASSVQVGAGQLVPDTDYVNDKGGEVTVSTHLINNSQYLQYYRMLGVSGTTSGGPYEYEILFKIAS